VFSCLNLNDVDWYLLGTRGEFSVGGECVCLDVPGMQTRSRFLLDFIEIAQGFYHASGLRPS
jgi:hypothetical protein